MSLRTTVLYALLAVAAFHLAYEVRALTPLMGVFAFAMVALARAATARRAFYAGVLIGLALYAPQLWFFAGIFKLMAVGLWLLLAAWIGLFLLLARASLLRLPSPAALLAIPVLWTGLEYFRSELYYLRFAWVTPGLAFSGSWMPIGASGWGFALMLAAALAVVPRGRIRWVTTAAIPLVMVLSSFSFRSTAAPAGPLLVGVQLEHPSERLVLSSLDDAIASHPNADLLILSEYTFGTPPPEAVREWCRRHQKHLLVGGVSHDDPRGVRNTAFVIGPDGRIVHTQGKSVPIQFFADGLPADRQELWTSPWGPIGICICYDLSYTRVVDRLIEQGAGAILVPTMDLAGWGERQHELHARLGPVRAAEYGVPVVRVCSSGVSQIVQPSGTVTAVGSFPGQRELIAGRIDLTPGGLPLDRWLAPACSVITAGLAIGLIAVAVRDRRSA